MNTVPHLAASDRFANSKRGLTHQTHPDGLRTLCGKSTATMTPMTRQAWDVARRTMRFCWVCKCANDIGPERET